MKPTTIGLLASLGLNIALVSFIGGRLAAGAPPGPMRDASQPRFLDQAGPETRDAFHDAFAERWADLRPLRRSQQEGRRALRDAIAADPFDRARAEAAWAEARDSEVALRSEHFAIMLDVLSRLPHSERRAVADAIAAGRLRQDGPPRRHDDRRGPHRGQRDGDGPDAPSPGDPPPP